ncbi:hypothetical protein HCN51_56075 [Nonomuraea sp. FMUSA5-5]|uniref:Uncharacterized protein n=1 Tax=Nonomuraea composti TaxID=2720023 RepID=A0ABX1BTQ9_9ACTN|nr:hypothetical protein [Nonomuraea sp. FMUSA5-5]NJP98643.1 hypothetical protein [Nonomuraea sp. FMUSA5-5]
MSEVWRLARDAVLPFGGPYGTVAHLRVYEPPPVLSHRAPVVIAGQFGDHTGRPLNAATGQVAAAIQRALFSSGRHFDYVEYQPTDRHERPYPCFRKASLRRRRRRRIERWLDRRSFGHDTVLTILGETGAICHTAPGPPAEEQLWAFELLGWDDDSCTLRWPPEQRRHIAADWMGTCQEYLERPAQVRLPILLGDTLVSVWPPAAYVPLLVCGPEAALQAAQIREAVAARTHQEMDLTNAFAATDERQIVLLNGQDIAADEGLLQRVVSVWDDTAHLPGWKRLSPLAGALAPARFRVIRRRAGG